MTQIKDSMLKKIIILLLFIGSIYSVFSQDGGNSISSSIGDMKVLGTDVENMKKKIDAVLGDLEALNAFKDKLDPNKPHDLWFGLKKNLGASNSKTAGSIMIALSEYKGKKGGTGFEGLAKVVFPNSDKYLYFAASNVRFGDNGDILPGARLQLLGEAELPMPSGTKQWRVILKGGNPGSTQGEGTFCEIGCDGVKSFGIDAEIVFPSDVLIPINKATLEPDGNTQLVRGRFSATVDDFEQILAEVSFSQPFALKVYPKMSFEVEEAVFDFSDTRNAKGVNFPDNYIGLDASSPTLWRGIYFKSLKVNLPREFSFPDTKVPPTIGGTDMLIDAYGFTGSVFAARVLNNLNISGGFQLSVDSLVARFSTGNFEEFRFNGDIKLPIKSDTLQTVNARGIVYNGMVDAKGEFLIHTENMSKLPIQLFGIKASIDSGSQLTMKGGSGQFDVEALINASMQFGVGTDKNANQGMKAEIQIYQLKLSTEAPYFDIGGASYKGSPEVGKLPFVITEIGLTSSGEEKTLKIGGKLALMENKLSASVDVELVGVLATVRGGGKSFNFKRFSISDIVLDNVNFGVFSLVKGRISFKKDDPLWGDGFLGSATVAIDLKLKVITIDGAAVFGKSPVDGGFRYWGVSLAATGLGIPTGVVEIDAIGGGVSYGMSRKEGTQNFGVDNFIPDSKSGLGLQIMIGGGAPTMITSMANLRFEILFGTNWGVRNVGFYGTLALMPTKEDRLSCLDPKSLQRQEGIAISMNKDKLVADLKNNGNFKDVAERFKVLGGGLAGGVSGALNVRASIGITMDFENDVFTANFDVYMNGLGGLLHGTGPQDKFGWGELIVRKGHWHLFLGTPETRNGLGVGIKGIAEAKFETYLMMGDSVGEIPPPPAKVREIINQGPSQDRDMGVIGNGGGFAFGADFSVYAGVDVGFFYAGFSAGLGFDILLKNYGTSVGCANTGKVVGMNGWYAKGQVYGYLEGGIGIRVKVFGVKKDIPILKAGIAALLNAELPNPVWAKATVAGYYCVLGGIIKGKFSLSVQIGEKCQMVNMSNNPLDDIKVISEIRPQNSNQDVDVFSIPQVVFNLPIGKEFSLSEEDDTRYKLHVQNLIFKPKNKEQPLAFKGVYEADNTIYKMTPVEILPGESEVDLEVIVALEECKQNKWQPAMDNGTQITQREKTSFTTGKAPNYIPWNNVIEMYPVKDQQYVYLSENGGKAYIQLNQGQSYLFENKEKYDYLLRYKSSGKVVLETKNMQYNTASMSVLFDMPPSVVKVNTSYVVEIVAVPKNTTQQASVQSTETQQSLDDANSMTIKENKAAGDLTTGEEIEYITYGFKTSRYGTFAEKMQTRSFKNGLYEIVTSDIGALQANVNGDEPFDAIELYGSIYSRNEPLIKAEATFKEDYFTKNIYPLVYQYTGQFSLNRDEQKAGRIPTKSVEAIARYEEWSQDRLFADRLPFRYNAVFYFYNDFRHLQLQVADSWRKDNPPIEPLQKLMSASFPVMLDGDYASFFYYRLPNGNASGQQVPFVYKN